MRILSVRVLLTCLLVMLSGPLDIALADGPYSGKVIDAETKEPIEGAVVVFVWMKRVIQLGRSQDIYEAAKETMTDKNGEFKLPGYTLTNIFTFWGVQPPDIIIFKPGYGDFPWHRAYPPRGDRSRNLLEYFRTNGLVELPRIGTKEERVKVYLAIGPVLNEVPYDPVLSNYRRMINIEESNLGISPRDWKANMDEYRACEGKKSERRTSVFCAHPGWERIVERYKKGCKGRKSDPYCAGE